MNGQDQMFVCGNTVYTDNYLQLLAIRLTNLIAWVVDNWAQL